MESTLGDEKLSQKFERVHPERERALNESGVGKIRNFLPISRRISETVQDTTKVTVNE